MKVLWETILQKLYTRQLLQKWAQKHVGLFAVGVSIMALLVHAFYRLVRRVLHLAARLLAWYHARRQSISSTRTP
jgi:uncharacterized protein HemY